MLFILRSIVNEREMSLDIHVDSKTIPSLPISFYERSIFNDER